MRVEGERWPGEREDKNTNKKTSSLGYTNNLKMIQEITFEAAYT